MTCRDTLSSPLAGAPDGQTPITPADVPPADGYAGDISPQTAWRWMQQGLATLVDVRTDAERAWVGRVPGAAVAAWKQWPGMGISPTFNEDVRAAAASGLPLMLLCRSGNRSVPAAQQATALGLTAFNVLQGFEGSLDTQQHRGQRDGWRHAGLPWEQG